MKRSRPISAVGIGRELERTGPGKGRDEDPFQFTWTPQNKQNPPEEVDVCSNYLSSHSVAVEIVGHVNCFSSPLKTERRY